jgi:hypothetical protein
MSPRSASGWPEWEEKNLLSWLDAHQELSWKARSDAYYEQHRVARSAESLRGKKYHILRKSRRTRAGASDRSDNQKPSKGARHSTGRRASLAAFPTEISAKSNIDKWFETILTAETDSNGSSQTESSRLGTKYISCYYLFSLNHYKIILCHRSCDASINPALA